MNAQLSGSKMVETIVLMSPNEILKNDSNGHGCCFKKCYYYNLWIICVQSLTTFPNLCGNLYLM